MDEKMDEKIFQIVFDKIAIFLPQEWKNVVYFVGYTEGSYSMKFYSQNENGKYVDCFNLQGVTKTALIKSFMELDRILSKDREGVEKGKRWTAFIMKVDNNGNMEMEFNYEDHSENMIEFENEWERKYLR